MKPAAPSSSTRALSALALGITLAATTGCGSSSDGGAAGAGTTTTGTGTLSDVRGDRYCEILVGKLMGSSVHVGVYNTYPLNDCPEAAWAAVDPAHIKADQKADSVTLNGPRYWTMDAFTNSALVDPTPVTLGGIQMHLAGTLDLPLSQVQVGASPYSPLDVARTTTWVYQAGKPVYELVDPQGRVFDMQSYSVQKTAQTQDSLAMLGSTLSLPSGWKFRTRVLDAELQVTAVDGLATVVQDELANTYQLSQQTP